MMPSTASPTSGRRPTTLNFVVDDIDAAADGLIARGVEFERYDEYPRHHDEKGVLRGLGLGSGAGHRLVQ